jgi:ferredoxin-NADP reductase/predicted pyridoxine 5'-phosphate oxidase superfamily flavin-nucleotide-binding protein
MEAQCREARTIDEHQPFHPGEQAVQSRMGVREAIEPWARRVIQAFMPDQHREFYARLPFLTIAARDEQGRPWATLLADEPGFATSPEPGRLSVDAGVVQGDALHGALGEGSQVGILGLDFATRRRNRINGRVMTRQQDTAQGRGGPAARRFDVRVDQAFGNCPQYIGGREWVRAVEPGGPESRRSATLDAAMQQWIATADTFFIASGYDGTDSPRRARGMDASHRGGEPGFVRVLDEQTVEFPDYAGNNHYNTIGNLLLDPRVGLLFVDFERGHLLQLTGTAGIDWGSDAVDAVPGARRLVRVRVEEAVTLRAALPIRWRSTGAAVRSMRVIHKQAESEDVTSFILAARDGGQLPDFEPGQHLPIEAPLPGLPRPIERSYSLSAAPGTDTYRLTVKRETQGSVSRWLHDAISPGDFINARAPAGDFVLRPGSRPVVLVSAGVGVTPMASMLGVLAREPARRPTWFVHGARDGAHHPLAGEILEQVAAHGHLHLAVAYSRPRPEDQQGRAYHRVGRVSAAWLVDLRGVPENQIHFESFGATG